MVVSAHPPVVLDASTTAVPDPDQFAYFCDALCDVYLGIRPQRPDGRGFGADVLGVAAGELILSRMRAPGHDARRTRRDLAVRPDDALYLNVSPTTDSAVETDAATTAVAAGVPVLLDNDAPFRLRFPVGRRFRLYSLRLPRALLPGFSSVGPVNARLAATPVGRELAGQAALMTRTFDAGRFAAAGAMADAVVALLREAVDAPAAHAAAIERYVATARALLPHPGAGAREIAARHGVSIRAVQAAFHAEGTTVTEWFARARLERAFDLLADAAHQPTVEAVARAVGWSDRSGFHRAFRARFGTTPAAVRDGARRPGAAGADGRDRTAGLPGASEVTNG